MPFQLKSPNLIRLVAGLSLILMLVYAFYPGWDELPFFPKLLYRLMLLVVGAIIWQPSRFGLLKQFPRLGMITILAFWAFVLYIGVRFSTDLDATFGLIPWYLWGIGVGLGVFALLPSPIANVDIVSEELRRTWALFFIAASLLRDTLFIWYFGINSQSDSNYYINSWHTLFYGGDGFDQPSYLPIQFFHALFNSVDSPWRVIIAQVLISALVLGLVVYRLSERQMSIAVVWGIFSMFDVIWAYNSRTLMTESLFINAFLLVILWVMRHIQRREALKNGELFLAGLFYGTVLLIRISGFPLFIPLMLVYVIIRKNWQTPVIVLAGIAIMFVGAQAFNRWQERYIQNVNPHALTWGYTMFYYQTFSPENGEASAELDQRLQECGLSYENYTREGSNAFAFLGLAKCLNEDELELLPASYWEMLLHNTLNYSKAVLNESAIFTVQDVQSTVLLLENELVDSTCYSTLWCLDLPRSYRFPLAETPLIPLIERTRYVQQPYFLLMPPAYFGDAYQIQANTFEPFMTPEAPQRNFPALAGALMLMGTVLVLSRGLDRIWLLAFSLFIWNQIGTTAAGQFFFPRMTMALSPFLSMWAAWLWVSLGKWLWPKVSLPRISIRPLLYAGTGICLLASAYFAWQSQDKTAYGSMVFISQVQDDLKEYPFGSVFNPSLNNYDWRIPNPFIFGSDTPAITQWRNTKAPGYLKQAGIEYLLVDHIWFSFVEEQTAQMFFDPDYYILEQEWTNQDGDQHIYLYRVVGDQTEAP